ncbi:hypothetical protein [Cyclobacterium plantarum]|uniref:hypothetical protein n=1 Tax=Cyclobacterium plantarum TaxID=2716263 RepID=UPI003F7074D7
MKTDSILFHKTFLKLIAPINKINIVDGTIEINTKPNLLEQLRNIDLEIEDLGESLRIISKSLPFKFFQSKEEFQTNFNFKDEDNILIFNNGIAISKIGKDVFIDFEKSESFYFKNILSYKALISFLKEKESEEENGFQFTDYMNLDLGKVTFIKETGNSRLKIKYEEKFPNFNDQINYSLKFDKFVKCFKGNDKYFTRFLKSSLIEYGNNIQEKNKLKNIFENLDLIINKANINFHVFLNDLSIEKFKKDYDELKSKYFKELSDILSKITQKIIALPIGISASLFAIERIKDNHDFLFFLLIIITATSILLSFIINSNLKDLSYLNEIFQMDFKQIKGNGFFKKIDSEFYYFKKIKEKFDSRVKFYFYISKIFYLVMNIGNSYLIIYIILNLELIADNGLIIISIVMGAIIIYFYSRLDKVPDFK